MKNGLVWFLLVWALTASCLAVVFGWSSANPAFASVMVVDRSFRAAPQKELPANMDMVPLRTVEDLIASINAKDCERVFWLTWQPGEPGAPADVEEDCRGYQPDTLRLDGLALVGSDGSAAEVLAQIYFAEAGVSHVIRYGLVKGTNGAWTISSMRTEL